MKKKAAVIAAAVIVGVGAVSGAVCAAVTTSQDNKEPERSSFVTTTTEGVTEITFAYDAEPSRQIAELIVQKYPDMRYVPTGERHCHPEYFIVGDSITVENALIVLIDKARGNNPAQTIVDTWRKTKPEYIYQNTKKFDIEAYRYSNEYYYVAIM